MSEDELITKMAELWIENGGDAEGILFCWRKLYLEVIKLTTSKVN